MSTETLQGHIRDAQILYVLKQIETKLNSLETDETVAGKLEDIKTIMTNLYNELEISGTYADLSEVIEGYLVYLQDITNIKTLVNTLNSKDFATQTTLALLNGKDFATQTTLNLLNGKDFSTNTTLTNLITEVQGRLGTPKVSYGYDNAYTGTYKAFGLSSLCASKDILVLSFSGYVSSNPDKVYIDIRSDASEKSYVEATALAMDPLRFFKSSVNVVVATGNDLFLYVWATSSLSRNWSYRLTYLEMG